MMAQKLTPQEASILATISHYAKSGTSREDLQPFIDKLKKKSAKKLAESYILKAEAARNTTPKAIAAQQWARVPKTAKTPQRRIRAKPLRIRLSSDEEEYRRLNREYKTRTGKWFKRTYQETNNNMSKLQAIKYRIELMDKGKMACEEALRKNDPEFHLGGAL